MRRSAALVLVATLVTLGACKSSESASSGLPRPSKAFCEAAARYDEKVQTRSLTVAEQVPYVERIATNAPDDIAEQAALFFDAMQRRADGDTSVVDDPEIRRAVDDVNRRAGQDCGWYERQGL